MDCKRAHNPTSTDVWLVDMSNQDKEIKIPAGPADYARSLRGPAAPASAAGAVNGAPLPPLPDGPVPANYLNVTPPTNQIDIMNPGTVYKAPNGGKITSFQTNRPNVNYSTFEKVKEKQIKRKELSEDFIQDNLYPKFKI